MAPIEGDAVLSQHKLMEVAMGGKPDGVDEIVDVPLASIPRLPPGHPMEYKVQMDHMHAVRTNKALCPTSHASSTPTKLLTTWST